MLCSHVGFVVVGALCFELLKIISHFSPPSPFPPPSVATAGGWSLPSPSPPLTLVARLPHMPRRVEPLPARPSAHEMTLEAEIALQRLQIEEMKVELQRALASRNHAQSEAKKMAETLSEYKKEAEERKSRKRRGKIKSKNMWTAAVMELEEHLRDSATGIN